jgi:V/A-type H+-transporting ATPase subunit A
MNRGTIVKVAGPLIVADNMSGTAIYDAVRVSDRRLIGEIIELRGDRASIQMYEETTGLGPGEPVELTGAPLSAELGPGLIGSMYDGIQRPLTVAQQQLGDRIRCGMDINALDRSRKWEFIPALDIGSRISGGDIIGSVRETAAVEHKIMAPPGVEGMLMDIRRGEFTVAESIAIARAPSGEDVPLRMSVRWPVRVARPIKHRLSLSEPMVTGQRVIDTFFPIARGGVAAIPGPFGSGKTVALNQLAKWSCADIVIYIGCGERGNEMAGMLMELSELADPRTGEPLLNHTVMIANTSDMPLAAREASVYMGITIAEYYRDMGFNVAVMVDSTSRWAEAMRDMSGRLEEMPGEEGYPAYLSSRIAAFYERAGQVKCLGAEGRMGSITAIGAVSPQGGDISEPVSRATLRIVKVFWGLSGTLANERHFPSIGWLQSYSMYIDALEAWFSENIAPDWNQLRLSAMRVLQDESELEELVRLVGIDALSPTDRFTLDAARSLREDFLQQDIYDDIDSRSSLIKQYRMISAILDFYNKGIDALNAGVPYMSAIDVPVAGRIARAKWIAEKSIADFDEIESETAVQFASLIKGGGHHT